MLRSEVLCIDSVPALSLFLLVHPFLLTQRRHA